MCRVRSDVPSGGANLWCLKDTAVALQLFPALFILMQSRLGKHSLCWCAREEQLIVGSASKGFTGSKRCSEMQPCFPSSCEPPGSSAWNLDRDFWEKTAFFSCDSSCALDVVGGKE